MVGLLAAAVAPAAAGADEPIMKLADVRAGMQCSALSVVRGTVPSEFRIDVIDVLRGEPNARGARILFRASGAAVDATGIGPGFSGSPIYCLDATGTRRVAGSISEGIGQYGNHVALATPIEEVLGVRATAPQARGATALLRSARPLAARSQSPGSPAPSARSTSARAQGRRPAAGGASEPERAGYAPVDPRPGTSIVRRLSTGDLSLGAVGTVTYRDGDASGRSAIRSRGGRRCAAPARRLHLHGDPEPARRAGARRRDLQACLERRAACSAP